jgi:hypothetical protein
MFAMGRRGASLLGLAAVLALVALAWWAVVEGGAATRGAATRAAPAASAARAGDDAPAASTDRPAVPPAPEASNVAALEAPPSTTAEPVAGADAEAVLVGRVLHAADDTPVHDAPVHVFVLQLASGALPAAYAVRDVTTDVDGRFRLAEPRAMHVVTVTVAASDGRALTELRPDLDVAPGETAELTLRAPRGATLSGVVLDADGRPVPGAQVLAWTAWLPEVEAIGQRRPDPDRRVSCDAAGRFVLSGAGPPLLLVPSAPGMAPVRGLHGRLADGETMTDVVLRLGPAHRLAGRVVDEHGVPVAGQPVLATRSDGRHGTHSPVPGAPLGALAVSGDDGRFALEPLAAGAWSVRTGQAPYMPLELRVEAPAAGLEITLRAGATLVGTVLGADNGPLAGAMVGLAGASGGGGEREAWTPVGARTDADGGFRIDGLIATEAAVLGVRGDDHAVHVVAPVRVGDQGAPPLVVRLAPAHRLAGTVLDGQGRPIEGAIVDVRGDRSVVLAPGSDALPWEGWLGTSGTALGTGGSVRRTDAEGRFAFDGLYDGSFAVTARHPDNAGLTVERAAASGTEDLVLVLDDAVLASLGTLAGHVTDAFTGAPVPSFSLDLFVHPPRLGPSARHGRFEHPEGAYRLDGIEPGKYATHCSAQGYAGWRGEPMLVGAGETLLDVALLPARTVHLRVVDQDGEPVPFVHVHFEDDAGVRVQPSEQVFADGMVDGTGRDGEVVVRGLPAGRLTLVLRHDRVPGADRWRAEKHLLLDLRVEPPGVVEAHLHVARERLLRVMLVQSVPGLGPGVYAEHDAAVDSYFGQDEERFLAAVRATTLARAVTVVVRDEEGAVVAEARCTPREPDGSDDEPRFDIESESELSSGEFPMSLVTLVVPLGPLRATIDDGVHPAVHVDLPEGEDHVERVVVLPATPPGG